ncbi:MAG: SDR family oxidoreductase [Alphaproteobacteria bacterium]
MESLDGKVAWVTGGGSGIGRAAALALAGAGARIVLSGRREARLGDTAREIAEAGGEAVVEPLDVSERAAVATAAKRIGDRFGRLDILLNNAGLNTVRRRFADLDPETWRRVVDVNLNGAFYCAAAALPMMRDRGEGLIINVSSWAGRYNSVVSGPAYGAAKHGMLALNASLNMEECRHGIRACAICPGEVNTPILDQRPAPLGDEEKARMLQPEDLAEIVLFVARMPRHVCLNEILVSPTWNRSFIGLTIPGPA